MAKDKIPIITITHSLLEGTMHTSVSPDVSEEDIERVGYLIRVGLLVLAEVLSDGLARMEGEKSAPKEKKPTSESRPSTSDAGKAYR